MVDFEFLNLGLLLSHGLLSVALLGAVSHQAVAGLVRAPSASQGFISRYAGVQAQRFSTPVTVLFLVVFVLGAVIYPEYRLSARYAIEEMRLQWVVGIFELKEHWLALGLGLLPLYLWCWHRRPNTRLTQWVTVTLALQLWFAFLVGHMVNNVRGL